MDNNLMLYRRKFYKFYKNVYKLWNENNFTILYNHIKDKDIDS